MKRLLLLIITSALLTGCGSSNHIQTVPIETILHDTLYINKQSYDSIYIDNTHLIDRGGDTVYIKDKLIEYRYRLLRDTIRIVQRDSIPYEVRITEIKEVRKPPNTFDYLCRYVFFLMCSSLLLLAFKFIRKFI